MYFDTETKVSSKALFMMPHKEEPMSAKEIKKEFPDFAKEFDGSARECTLSFYYKYNKQEGVFEFLDIDSEEEVAELLGVQLLVKEQTEEKVEEKSLTEEQVNEFRKHIEEIRSLHKEYKEKEGKK